MEAAEQARDNLQSVHSGRGGERMAIARHFWAACVLAFEQSVAVCLHRRLIASILVASVHGY